MPSAGSLRLSNPVCAVLVAAHEIIRRVQGCDVHTVDSLGRPHCKARLVSRRHARLDRTAEGWRLTDLGSSNGTFVNGRRIAIAMVTERDDIGIGHGLLQLRDGGRLSPLVHGGGSTFEADDITVTTATGSQFCSRSASPCPKGVYSRSSARVGRESPRCSMRWRGTVPLTGAPSATPAASCIATTTNCAIASHSFHKTTCCTPSSLCARR